MASVVRAWKEETSYPKLNIAIGSGKLIAGMALTAFAIQKLPKWGIAGGVLLSLTNPLDLLGTVRGPLKIPSASVEDEFERIDDKTLRGHYKVRSLQKGVELSTLIGLGFLAITSLLRTRQLGPLATSARVAGCAIGFVVVGAMPVVEMWACWECRKTNSSHLTVLQLTGMWLGVMRDPALSSGDDT